MHSNTASSREEQDRLIKERIKKERREQTKAAAGLRQSTVTPGVQHVSAAAKSVGDEAAATAVMTQEEKDGLIKRMKRERMDQIRAASNMKHSTTAPGMQFIASDDRKHPPEGTTTPGVQIVALEDRKHPPEVQFSGLKLEDTKDRGGGSKRLEFRKKAPAASLRQSAWSGLYDGIIDKEFDGSISTRTLPKPEEDSYEANTSTAKSTPIFASYQIKDAVDGGSVGEASSDRIKKSKHRHQKSHSHHSTEDQIEVEETRGKHRKSRHHKRSSNVSTASEESTSRSHKHSEEGGSSSRHRKRSDRKSHLKMSLTFEGGDDELSRRIEEKLREREKRKKEKRSVRKGHDGQTGLADSQGGSAISNIEHAYSEHDGVYVDRRELSFRTCHVINLHVKVFTSSCLFF